MDYLFKFWHSVLQRSWKKETPDRRAWRTKVYWESETGLVIRPQADVSVCDFIQLQNIYLSHYVNTHVEQRHLKMNSPVPQHTLYIMPSTHTHTYTEFSRHSYKCAYTRAHMLWHKFVYPARSRPVCGFLSFAHLMCEKWKEIKVISFILVAVGCGSLGQEGRHWQ